MSDPKLEELRKLLFAGERERLQNLEQRIEQRPGLDGLSEELPQALSAAAARDQKLSLALQQPIRDGVARTVRQDPQGFAEILFPAMGPSIRRAISQALKDFTRTLNRSAGRGMLWRVDALRRGVPYSQVVFEKTLAHRVEQAILIDANTGLVVSQAELSDLVARDHDAFSAMLTAIQDFVRDSFEGDNELSNLEMGERTVWILRGARAHLACVISGVPTSALRDRLADIHDQIHLQHEQRLATFDGSREGLEAIDTEVAKCLDPGPTEAQTGGGGGLKTLLIVAAIALAIALLWWLLRSPPEDKAAAVLDASPGIAVNRVERSDGRFIIHGLRDPLAEDPSVLLRDADIPQQRIEMRLDPYVSLEPQIVARRALAQLEAPDSVQGRVEQGVLILDGSAPRNWLNRALSLQQLPLGVTAIRTTVAADWRSELQLPAGVELRETTEGLVFSGNADLDWIRGLRSRLEAISAPPLAPQQELVPEQLETARSLATELDGAMVFFDQGTRLRADAAGDIDQMARTIRTLERRSRELNAQLEIRVMGFTDGTGDPQLNLKLREQRARTLASALHRSTPLHTALIIDPQPEFAGDVEQPQAERRAGLSVTLSPPNGDWH